MHECSNTIAHNLRKLGIKKGDNVLVFLNNSPEFIMIWMIWFALIKIGTKYAFSMISDGLCYS